MSQRCVWCGRSSDVGVTAGLGVLSGRELEVLAGVAHGRTNDAIGRLLFISVDTVKDHVSSVMRKLGAVSRVQAVTIGFVRGLLPLPELAEVESPSGDVFAEVPA